jgi:hypothetical protein
VLRGTESTVGLIGDIEQDSALLASEDNDFLIRMGVSRKLLTDIMYRQKAVKEQAATARPAAASPRRKSSSTRSPTPGRRQTRRRPGGGWGPGG